ncbi:MAG TPA: hypothetical protein VHX60_14785 [Acidobacteriaceae bacterium]|jgi:hypothetical protein|nr:hypothetical protein [Acidobacteriaceae bacterium]
MGLVAQRNAITSWERESAVVWDSGDPMPVSDNGAVRFRLLYSGDQLVAGGNASAKHVIRKKFHPQLRVLWETHPLLRDMAIRFGAVSLSEAGRFEQQPDIEKAAIRCYLEEVGTRYARGNFHFVPLIDADVPMRVSIDILFLRRDQQPLIKQGGDIDNRLKTLFDALRVPDTTDGLGGGPDEGEDPFFVLIQDDAMISEVRVSTDNLLLLPDKPVDAKDAFLVIDVDLRPTKRTTKSWVFD